MEKFGSSSFVLKCLFLEVIVPFLKKSLRLKKRHYQNSKKHAQMYKIPTNPEWLANAVARAAEFLGIHTICRLYGKGKPQYSTTHTNPLFCPSDF